MIQLLPKLYNLKILPQLFNYWLFYNFTNTVQTCLLQISQPFIQSTVIIVLLILGC